MWLELLSPCRYVSSVMKTSTTEELVSELRTIGMEMRTREEQGTSPEVSEPTSRLQQAATQVAMTWSGSNLGYHSRVYYEGLAVPPPGAHFSSEWGSGSGGWHEYPYDDVVQYIYHLADDPDLTRARAVSDDARRAFEEAQADVASIISAFLAQHPDEFLTSVKGAVEKLIVLTQFQATRMQMPTGTLMWSRDTLAMSQGLQSAPHQGIFGELLAARSVFTACSELGRFASRAAAHIERLNMARGTTRAQGQSVFIGHGRSPLWRELKDFIQDRLHLPWEEFNRVPIAGVTNIARLAQMLDSSGIAFLILTAEDERTDGSIVARQNVVHEAGLFQGRLDFARAIVLLEEGCEEFSNIQGLGHIHFPRGRIQAAFEEVRRVLEREGFLDM
jgi:predicted nucleotide-binding protein